MPKTTRTFPTLDAFIDASWGKRPRMDKASCAYYDTIVGRLRKLDSLVRPAIGQPAGAWYGLGDGRTELRLGPIREDPIWTFWRGLDVPMKLRNSLNQLGNPVHIEGLAGAQKVIAWASRRGSRAKLVHRMARMLGRDLSFPALTEELT